MTNNTPADHIGPHEFRAMLRPHPQFVIPANAGIQLFLTCSVLEKQNKLDTLAFARATWN